MAQKWMCIVLIFSKLILASLALFAKGTYLLYLNKYVFRNCDINLKKILQVKATTILFYNAKAAKVTTNTMIHSTF